MTMETIEERAIKIATQRIGYDYSGKTPISQDAQDWYMIYSACYDALTEQERIIRNEERERCIRVAQECIKELIDTLVNIKQIKGTTVIEFDIDAINAELRKAIEENS